MLTKSDLKLLNVTSGDLVGRAFVTRANRRHFVMNADLLPDYGLNYPDDAVGADEHEIQRYIPSQRLPKRWTKFEREHTPADAQSWQMREIAAATLSGDGVEFGALAAPFPVPIECSVTYADLLSHEELLKAYPNEPRESMVIPTLRTHFEAMDIEDNSLDFIVASHVIEHTVNPIGAIVKAFRALKPGGSLVLVIPDMRRTFDRQREQTTLDHLIDDFKDPSHERDRPHHIEYFKLAFPREDYESAGDRSWQTKQPIHYHTWIYQSFDEMVEWVRRGPAPFKEVWSHPTLPREVDDFEFYFVLTK